MHISESEIGQLASNQRKKSDFLGEQFGSRFDFDLVFDFTFVTGRRWRRNVVSSFIVSSSSFLLTKETDQS